MSLSGLMDLMARLAQLDGNYFMTDYDELKVNGEMCASLIVFGSR